MHIRPATPDDRSAIVSLLQKSMSESIIPKSEALWIWKHEQNPFGPSYVLVAEENNNLIGLRAFMQWEWLRNNRIYNSIRAVDTATHPDYQGRGIFKTLTLKQLEICEQQGVHFVFNTPNQQSKPGYLKMGWVEQGKMPIKFKLLRPYAMAKEKLFNKEKSVPGKEDPTPYQKWSSQVLDLLNNHHQKSKQLSTVLSPEYISWRYANNPLFAYNYFTDFKSFLLISRIKQHSFTKELRLVDFVLLNSNSDNRYINGLIKNEVLDFCSKNDIGFISLSGQQYETNKSCFKWMGMLPVMKQGPVVTLRDLNMKENFHHLLNVKNWCYSTGDLELF